MDVLAQIRNYDTRYSVPRYICKYEGRCQYKSAVLKVIMLKKNKDDS